MVKIIPGLLALLCCPTDFLTIMSTCMCVCVCAKIHRCADRCPLYVINSLACGMESQRECANPSSAAFEEPRNRLPCWQSVQGLSRLVDQSLATGKITEFPAHSEFLFKFPCPEHRELTSLSARGELSMSSHLWL